MDQRAQVGLGFTARLDRLNHLAGFPNMRIIMTVTVIILMIVMFLFIRSIMKTLNQVPKEKHFCSQNWLWLLLVPILDLILIWTTGMWAWMMVLGVISLVGRWIMLPFGVPGTLNNHFESGSLGAKKTKAIRGVGLAMVICSTLALVPVLSFFSIAGFVLWIIYWCQVVSIRRYFGHQSQEGAPAQS